MSVIEQRKANAKDTGNWVLIWTSDDGRDTARYLQILVEEGRIDFEFHMTFEKGDQR